MDGVLSGAGAIGAGREILAGAGRVETLFFCIGAQKAGTTWLYSQLASNPRCHLAPAKEVRFWDAVRRPGVTSKAPKYAARWLAQAKADRRDSMRRLQPRAVLQAQRRLGDAAAYARLTSEPRIGDYARFMMRGYAGQPLVGEMSTNYALLDRDAFREMAGLHPNTRFVLVMRDPVARLWSGIRHREKLRRRHGDAVTADADVPAAFAAAAADPGADDFPRSRYDDTVRALDEAVPATQRLYLFYETMFAEPSLAELARFLGVGRIAADGSRRFNAGILDDVQPPEAMLEDARRALAPVYDFVSDRFGEAVPASWRAPR